MSHGNAKAPDGKVKWARALREQHGYTFKHIGWIVRESMWTVRSWIDGTNRGEL